MNTRDADRIRRGESKRIGSRVLILSLAFMGYAALGETPEARPDPSATATATFAGGCFWCMEPPFDALDGVLSTTSGYIGGDTSKPSYKQVSAGGSGHAEAVQVIFDPTKISYAELLDVFWRNIDPLAVDRQFCDIGDQYRSAIFAHDDEQEKLARASREAIASSGKLEGRVVTEIVKGGQFWPAEEYHQNYYQKNPLRYKYYRYSCGRDRRLAEIWGDAA